MHTCFDPYIIYGIYMNNNDLIMDDEWADQCDMGIYWNSVSKAYGHDQIIGVPIDIDINADGSLSMTFSKDGQKERVDKVFAYLQKTYPRIEFDSPAIHAGLRGDVEFSDSKRIVSPRYVLDKAGEFVKNKYRNEEATSSGSEEDEEDNEDDDNDEVKDSKKRSREDK